MNRLLSFLFSIITIQMVMAQSVPTPIFRHDFNGSKNASYFTLGANLSLATDKFFNPDNAIYLPASHQRMILDYSTQSTAMNTEGSISFWYKFNSYSGGSAIGQNYPILYVTNGNSSYHEGLLLAAKSGPIPTDALHVGLTFGSSGSIGFSNSTSIAPVTGLPSNFDIKEWHFYTITFVNTGATKQAILYIDGAPITTRSFYGFNNTSYKQVHFGGWGTTNTSNNWSTSGWFDNIKVFEQKLWDQQVITLYNSENITPNITALYSHYFQGTKVSPSFIVGNNLSLTDDYFENPQKAIYLPNNHDKLKLDFTEHASTLKSEGSISFWFNYENIIGSNKVGNNEYPILI